MLQAHKFIGLSVFVGWLLVGCAHGNVSVPFANSSLEPAAEGQVMLTGKGENKTLRVQVHHLAEPQNLNPQTVAPASGGTTPPQTYVVWLQPMGGPPENLGVLTPDKNLDANLTTTTSQHRFDVFVTAEPTATQTAPTGQRLLQATVQD